MIQVSIQATMLECPCIGLKGVSAITTSFNNMSFENNIYLWYINWLKALIFFQTLQYLTLQLALSLFVMFIIKTYRQQSI